MNIKICYQQKSYYSIFCISIYILAILFTSKSEAQVKGKVIDKENKIPIPFASVIYQVNGKNQGIITDVRGDFFIKDQGVTKVSVSCLGYVRQNFEISPRLTSVDLFVELEKYTSELPEFTVTRQENPALRIIRKVLENKNTNNYQNINHYGFRSYVKTIIDLKSPENVNARDSAFLNRTSVKGHAGFISEYVMDGVKDGNREENKIIAQKTSGIDNPDINQLFATIFHNSISFYNNAILLYEYPISEDLQQTEYVSPLADGCLKMYKYHIEDTLYEGEDSIFLINFYPAKGKLFNSLKGKMYINTHGYAIQNIVVEPTDGLIAFRFMQQYSLIQGHWFPVCLNEDIGWKKSVIRKGLNLYLAYIISVHTDSINFSPGKTSFLIRPEPVYVSLSGKNENMRLIENARPDSLTPREKATYTIVDSVFRKKHIDLKFQILEKFCFGKIPLSFFDVNYGRLLNYNQYEDFRLGIGGQTNEKFSRRLILGGYLGYGTKDKAYKYGGAVTFNICKRNNLQLNFSSQNTLKEIGNITPNVISDNYLDLDFSEYMGTTFDKILEHKTQLSLWIFRFLKINAAVNIRELKPLYPYVFKGNTCTSYYADEFGIKATLAFNQSITTFGNFTSENYDGNPKIDIGYNRGIDFFRSNSLKYNKIEASIDYTLLTNRMGQASFRLEGGFIDKALPYGLLFTGTGCNDEKFRFYVDNKFQTMKPYEFTSDRFVNLFFSHNFGQLLFSSKVFKPRFVVIHNTGWGVLKYKDVQNSLNLNDCKNIYIESGLMVKDLIKLNIKNLFYVGIGVGGFYRYGYYGFENAQDNLALKMNLSVSFK
jgi:hypothetical protein